jgi:hypothetical protein
MVSTEEGIHIPSRDEHREKADSPRIETQLLVSDVTIERPLQDAKHDVGIVSIDEGMQIDWSDDDRKKGRFTES